MKNFLFGLCTFFVYSSIFITDVKSPGINEIDRIEEYSAENTVFLQQKQENDIEIIENKQKNSDFIDVYGDDKPIEEEKTGIDSQYVEKEEIKEVRYIKVKGQEVVLNEDYILDGNVMRNIKTGEEIVLYQSKPKENVSNENKVETDISNNNLNINNSSEEDVQLNDDNIANFNNQMNESEVEETVEEEVVEETSDPFVNNYEFPFITRDYSKPFLNREPNKLVILDVDMNTDVDDVCAVRMATTLDDLGIIDLKAVCYCVDNSSLSALRGILHHDGKDDVLIGQGTEQREDESPYWNVLGNFNDFNGDKDGAVRQYRKVLANANRAVDIVTTGHLTNLEALLKSGPDDISPLTGKELIMSKVGQLYIVGGENPGGWSNNLALTGADIVATKYVTQNWELPIIWSPSQTGGLMNCGRYLQDLDTGRVDPVTNSLYAFGTSSGRAAWDPFGMWICGYACGIVNQVNLNKVTFSIRDNGVNEFSIDPNGKDYLVTLSNSDLNYYNQTMDNHLIYMLTKKYGIQNPNKEPIGIHLY